MSLKKRKIQEFFSSILLAMHICYNLVINHTLSIALDKKPMSKLSFFKKFYVYWCVHQLWDMNFVTFFWFFLEASSLFFCLYSRSSVSTLVLFKRQCHLSKQSICKEIKRYSYEPRFTDSSPMSPAFHCWSFIFIYWENIHTASYFWGARYCPSYFTEMNSLTKTWQQCWSAVHSA